jgi:hypothetical protein
MWPQNDHVERSDLAMRFFIAGWERERVERAKSLGIFKIWSQELFICLGLASKCDLPDLCL